MIDFVAAISDAKAASQMAIESLAPGYGFAAIVTDAGNINLIDAMVHVERNYPNCDRRRRKREMRKALAKARVGAIPAYRVTAGPATLQDREYHAHDPIVMTGPIDISSDIEWRIKP